MNKSPYSTMGLRRSGPSSPLCDERSMVPACTVNLSHGVDLLLGFPKKDSNSAR